MSSFSSLERIFFECLRKGTPEERGAHLSQACAGDAELLRRLQRMLEAHDDGGFLEQAAFVGAPGAELRAAAERPGQRIGVYRLVEPIGEGGMGTVWRAEQVEPVQRQVALKLIKAGMDSRQVIARFEAERQALALMDHPNIARVLDGGADEAGRPYFVMDLFAGVPITRFCDERRLGLQKRLELFVQVCEAIQHAHHKGVIHRDIKPSNVLVAQQDERAVPKVIDFGIAKAIEQKLTEHTMTQPGGLVGTLEYMSPEQSVKSTEGVDTRSDVYSLGALLYELITGGTPLSRRLVESSSLPEILRVIADEETPKPSTRLRAADPDKAAVAARRGVAPTRLASLVSGELDWIAMKALEKDRDRRYASAADLAQDVRRFLADEPVTAGPPSALYRLRKLARRRRAALAAASALFAALLVAIGGVGWAVRDKAARTAEAERTLAGRRARVLAAVEELLAAADQQMAAQAWREALATVRRADAAAVSGEADPATAQRVRDLVRDLELVERLDRIRSRPAKWGGSASDSAAMVREYLQAFRDHGVDLQGAPVEATIGLLRRTPAVGMPVAAGLDDMVRRARSVRDHDTCRRCVLVADGIDPDPVRASIRAVWGRPDVSGVEELERLVVSIDVRAHPPATLLNLARAVASRQPADAGRLLRAAQHAHPGDFWLAFELGADLVDVADLDGALVYATAAVAIRPESAAAHTNLGHVLSNRGDVEGAIASARRAIELDPTLAMPWVNLSRALVEQRKPEEALASARKAVELDPQSALAWIGLGTVLLELQRSDEAGNAFQRALELDPTQVYALAGASNVHRARGELREALELARQAVAAEPGLAEGYIALGNALAESRDFGPSSEAFRKAIELEPENAVAHGNLGNVVSNDPARREEAIALHRRAIELDPGYAIGHLGLGNALYVDGRWEAAGAAFRDALRLDPSLDAARINAGHVLLKQQRPAEALVEFQEVVSRHPDHAEAHYGIALAHYARNERKEAEVSLRTSLAHDPDRARVHHSLAALLVELGRVEEAIESYRRAAELEPDVATRHLVLAANLCSMGRYEEAVAASRRTLELDPRIANAHQILGLALTLQSDYAEALGVLDRAVDVLPSDASVAGTLALLLVTCPVENLRDPARAVELATKAHALEPRSADHCRTLGAASYRAGNWQDALDALQIAAELDPKDPGLNWFYAAMAQRQLGDDAAARAAYDRGCDWMERTRSAGEDVRALREEAASLLGVEIRER